MKKPAFILLMASLFMFTGASPWEGAAVVAPEGVLPVTGFFIATDSFPRNTVVDITNIETGKSTRVIVANRLENPDLLAVVSREAAELIGMTAGSITRLRIVQPTEPIAYTRFVEGVNSGIPEYDSGNVLTEELYREDTYRPASQLSVPAPTDEVKPPSYTLEPEWRTRGVIVDFPYPAYTPNVDSVPAEKPAEPKQIAETQPEKPAVVAEVLPKEEVKEVEEIAEAIPEEPEENEEIAEEPSLETTLVLVPAEERPPESLYGINPADIIPGIRLPEPEWSPETPVDAQPPQIAVPEQTFSVPRITELNRGWYYVQIAAYDTPQSVENALKQIDHSYRPVVYKDDDAWYRILLGPLNQGESAAILQRFKSIGYRDAFVRHIR